jgi:hypothetical protein
VIEAREHPGKALPRRKPVAVVRLLPWLLGVCGALAAHAGPLVSNDSPIGFFTNVASRLLQSQLGLSLNDIQVYPTNQYTPAVHRLLQVSANLYDATTNRADLAPGAGPPCFPTVFRPIFTAKKGTSGKSGPYVTIVGYRELNAADMLAITNRYDYVRDLSDPNDFAQFNPATDMVYNIPLIIGARKGFPTFNKFAMHTAAQVTRKLQYHRQNDSNTGPINEIDQMFVAGISNVLGVEAWNSYLTPYPRQLAIYVWPDISLYVTNLETGNLLNTGLYRSRQLVPVTTNVPPSAWPGYDHAQEWISFVIPLLTNIVFLPNSTYRAASDSFMPLTGAFERNPGATNFHLPHWQVTVKPRLRVAVVDVTVSPNRLVDYVNLADINTLDLTGTLAAGAACGSPYILDGSNGSMWCTNRDGVWDGVPTYGIRNQIEASLGHVNADWTSSTYEFPPGMSISDAQTFFKDQFLPTYMSRWTNVFNPPFQPFRNIYLTTSWQANDPLVHYMVSDLIDLGGRNIEVDQFDSTFPDPVVSLGSVNSRYRPWGRHNSSSGPGPWDITIKDPVSRIAFTEGRSDAWDFPTNQTADASWLGRVHRGTPWQTIYLKAPAADFSNWQQWTGDAQLVNWNGRYVPISDSLFTHPTNDWRLASLLAPLFSTNSPRNCYSLNQSSVPAWCSVLDGMTVLTNTPYGELDSLVMQSNSPQALTIATALNAMQASRPGHLFRDPAELLSAPELTSASPWLYPDPNPGNSALTDAAYEAIPVQLLSLLRPDSVGSVRQAGDTAQIQFTGLDPWPYLVQTSANLRDWTTLSTNYPTNGTFTFSAPLLPSSPRCFYRSALMP